MNLRLSSMIVQEYGLKFTQISRYAPHIFVDSRAQINKFLYGVSDLVKTECRNEFLEVFPEDPPGVPLQREIYFGIDVLPDIHHISITPYIMAPYELKKLIEKLKDLLDKDFIRPSIFPWGA
ncbi:hypothetical protein MTR67_034442 [Solanum verrucosum]|uniref:Uncharacterized protein n=1 Tax=Solanum verrucosum TaxID=315347 RepID=A0AAF0ZJ92_SOLVR|nr:hypothetical protein MTR67_034442 [Solanum verrucosum]